MTTSTLLAPKWFANTFESFTARSLGVLKTLNKSICVPHGESGRLDQFLCLKKLRGDCEAVAASIPHQVALSLELFDLIRETLPDDFTGYGSKHLSPSEIELSLYDSLKSLHGAACSGEAPNHFQVIPFGSFGFRDASLMGGYADSHDDRQYAADCLDPGWPVHWLRRRRAPPAVEQPPCPERPQSGAHCADDEQVPAGDWLLHGISSSPDVVGWSLGRSPAQREAG